MKSSSQREYVEESLQKLKCNGVNLMEGTRVQMIINRAVGNTNKGSKRWVNKLISYDEKSYMDNVEKLMNQLVYLNQQDLRLYASINERYLFKSARNLTVDIIDHLNDARFLSHIHNEFVSHLMQPECRQTKYILIDCDSHEPEIVNAIRATCGEKIIMEYYTPNGWHFICHGFDTRPLIEINTFLKSKGIGDKDIVEIKKDGLMLITPGVGYD